MVRTSELSRLGELKVYNPSYGQRQADRPKLLPGNRRGRSVILDERITNTYTRMIGIRCVNQRD